MSEERQFAYGKNQVEDCNCPASQAGFEPVGDDKPELRFGEIADQYDNYVALELFKRDGGNIENLKETEIYSSLSFRGYLPGVVDEEIARECWMKAIEAKSDSPSAARAGKKVAKELGWD